MIIDNGNPDPESSRVASSSKRNSLGEGIKDPDVKNILKIHQLGDTGWPLYSDFIGAGVDERYSDGRGAEYQAKHRAEVDARHPGVGLKSYELDYDAFDSITDYSALNTGTSPLKVTLRGYYNSHRNPDADDPWGVMPRKDRDDNFFAGMINSAAVSSRVSRELDAYIKEFEPFNTFFTPEMVCDAVHDNSDVSVAEADTPNGLHTWTFQDTEGKKITLSRRESEGADEEHAVPYLGVLYETEYDEATQELVTNPVLWLGNANRTHSLDGDDVDANLYSTLRDSLLARTLVDCLKLPADIRHYEPLEFRMVGAKVDGYLRPAEPGEHTAKSIAPLAIESVMKQSHVIADLPKARKEGLGLAKQVLPSQRPE